MPLISIIIRTRDEERWIAACLRKVQEQNVTDVEIVLVDNGSRDKTVERALAVMPGLIVVRLEEFLPGLAINEGIRASSGQHIVCLSSHCIPKDAVWLENLLRNFSDQPRLAGVYGRQIPMHFTNSHDKRDLLVTFGLDRRVQYKDPFFHNANSMFPRRVWEQFPFDEAITNIEDRVWAKLVLSAGYHIVYEPEAAVYHHHGIYQNRDEQRLRNVLRIVADETPAFDTDLKHPFHQDNLHIAAIIPARGESGLTQATQDRFLESTIRHAQAAPSVNKVIVSTDSQRIQDLAVSLGAEVPFLRRDDLTGPGATVLDVLRQTLDWYEAREEFFDYVATLEITHPFRPPGIVQQCIEQALRTGLESIVAGMPEYRPCWWLEQDEYRRIDDYLNRRDQREPIHVGLPAVCSVLLPDLIRGGKRIAQRVGIVELTNPMAALEIRTESDVEALNAVLEATNGVGENVAAKP